MTPRDTLVEELVTAWVQWSKAAAHEPRADALVRATAAVAGDRALELRRHIQTEMQAIAETARTGRGTAPTPRDVRQAVHRWLNTGERGAVA